MGVDTATRICVNAPMTVEQVRTLLRKRCAAAGSMTTWAGENGVSIAYVSDILAGRREPGESVLTALGLERVISYRKKDSTDALDYRQRTQAAIRRPQG